MKSLLLLSLVFFSWSCQEKKAEITGVKELSGKVFGSTYSIKYVGDLDPQTFSSDLEKFFKDFNAEFSTYQENSVISQFNVAPAGMKIKVNKRFISMLKLIRDLHEKTEGAFDPTVGPVIKAWKSGNDVEKAKAFMGMKHLHWDEASEVAWKTRKGLSLDLNAFAPGWAADLIGEELVGHGIQNFMVDIGGEILVKGKKDSDSWVIGIEKPSENTIHEIQMAVKIQDLSIATSGNYRQFFLESGEKRSHIIDPRTAYPVKHMVSSVTTLAPTAVEADAWGTALMVLGEKGMELAEKNGIFSMFLKALGPGKFEVVSSPGMKTYLEANQL